jgi:hypothetical protein
LRFEHICNIQLQLPKRVRDYSAIVHVSDFGGLAQLGERLHGMQEVSGSIPLSSTN